jgi:hypothetical protein
MVNIGPRMVAIKAPLESDDESEPAGAGITEGPPPGIEV